MFSSTLRTTLVPGLVLAALALSGCGGGTAGASASPAATSAAAPSDGAASESAAASPSASSVAAEVGDPCSVLDADQIASLTGVKVKKGTASTVATSKLCTWTPSDATASDAAVFSAQEGPLPGPLSQVESQLESEFDAKITTISVPGADDARYLTGKKSGLNIVDVLAQKDEVFYQVLVASPRNATQHKAGAIKVAAALVQG